ncbi:MAG: HTTM domain-containing protein [Bdellovibrionaceae bacterium]|nr:HTTM domain-containing protein [Pseudobdellovibrionaceae bacterium]
MSLEIAIQVVSFLCSLSVLMNALEYHQLRTILEDRYLPIEIALSLTMMIFGPLAAPGLMALHLRRIVRLGGPFNGGSDYMLAQVLLALSLCHLPKPIPNFAFFFLAVQLGLSYFRSGLVKVCNPRWRQGRVLAEILQHSPLIQQRFKIFFQQISISPLAWATILFDLLVPLSFLHIKLAAVFCGFALVFHLGNFLVFGLNRFFWVWMSAWPSLFWASSQLKEIFFS